MSKQKQKIDSVLFISSVTVICLMFSVFSAAGQTPTPSPDTGSTATWNGFRVTSVTEIGWRWRSLDGNENKYRSDLNYKQGFRSFDTNLLLQNVSGDAKYVDSLLITNSGWGSDPQGFTRVNIEKTGFYKFSGNVRRVTYFNNLYNFANPLPFPRANSEHSMNSDHTFGDFDVTIAPQSDRLRVTMGGSFNHTRGDGFTTSRFFGDEFPVNSKVKTNSRDFRVLAEGTLIDFDWGLSQGYREYRDRSNYFLLAPDQGNNPANTSSSRLDTFGRAFPTDGHANYTQFNLHRLFAGKFDFTGRIIYTKTNTNSNLSESMTGKDNANPGILVTSDVIEETAKSSRPQTRADIGVTYAVTDNLRFSNTFSFDQFTVSGAATTRESWIKANGARSIVTNIGHLLNPYRRYSNTVEGDYQFNNAVGVHLGYRYAHRMAGTFGFYRTVTCNTTSNPACPPANPTIATRLFDEEETNTTNTFLAGMKIRPVHHWVIFWDVERGQADNVFTRLENYKFTNFRVRSKMTFNKFAINLSALSKDNDNPSLPVQGIGLPANLDFVTAVNNRFYTGSVDWDPLSKLSFSSGYTYRHLTSHTPIALPISGAPGPPTGYAFGFSEFFIRDRYFYFDVTAKPASRISLYVSYRIDRDKGQGSRITLPTTLTNPNIIGSYPMRFTTPEFRAAFRITKNVDWNVGYQYYDYNDVQTPFLNYRAHLPYTSLRIYLGGGAADR